MQLSFSCLVSLKARDTLLSLKHNKPAEPIVQCNKVLFKNETFILIELKHRYRVSHLTSLFSLGTVHENKSLSRLMCTRTFVC